MNGKKVEAAGQREKVDEGSANSTSTYPPSCSEGSSGCWSVESTWWAVVKSWVHLMGSGERWWRLIFHLTCSGERWRRLVSHLTCRGERWRRLVFHSGERWRKLVFHSGERWRRLVFHSGERWRRLVFHSGERWRKLVFHGGERWRRLVGRIGNCRCERLTFFELPLVQDDDDVDVGPGDEVRKSEWAGWVIRAGRKDDREIADSRLARAVPRDWIHPVV